jgi:hypothetical protein
MPDEQFTTKRMLVLRKLTRAMAELLREQLKEYLATLAFVLRPKNVFGEFVDGPKDVLKGAEAAFKELQTTYGALASTRPFNLPTELRPPLEVASTAPEITPVEYAHVVKTDGTSKTVTVTAPLKWVLSYAGLGPRRLKELLAAGQATSTNLQELVLHTLLLHGVLARQSGLKKILGGLRFSITPGRLPGCGELPFTFVTAAVGTIRPPDEVIIENTEISGMDVFEEVVNLADLAALRDPFKEKLTEVAKQHGEDLTILSASTAATTVTG